MGIVEPQTMPTTLEHMRWEFHSVKDFHRFSSVWDEVNRAAAGNPTLSSVFVNVLAKVFCHGDELLAICRIGELPIALGIVHKIAPGLWQTFQPSQAPLGLWIWRPDISRHELMPGLITALPGIPMLIGITQMSEHYFPKPNNHGSIRFLDYAETASILVNQPFEQYWQARDASVRRQVERRLRRLHDGGIEPNLEIIIDPAVMQDAIADFGHIESMGWKGAEGTAIHVDNIQGVFYSKLLTDLARLGHGTVYRYKFNTDTVAMELCIESDGTLVMLKTTYDEKYAAYAPGILMRHAIFEHVFSTGRIDRIEFLGKLQPWQVKWCDETYWLYHVNYYRWPWMAAIRNIIAKIHHAGNLTTGSNAKESVAPTATAPAGTYVASVHQDLNALNDGYEDLFFRNESVSFFHTLPWYRTFVQTTLTSREHVRIYAVESAFNPRSPRGVLIMRHQDSPKLSWRPRILTGLANYYTSLFGPVIDPDESDAQPIFDQLAAAIAYDEIRWDVIDLHPLDIDAPSFTGMVTALRNAGLLVHTYYCFGNWHLQVNNQTYSDYISARPSRLSKTGKRQRRILEKDKQFRFELFTGTDRLEQALADYNAIYTSSWKVPEPHPNFIGKLMRTCAEQGWLRLGIAYMDGQPAAAQLWIVVGGQASIYKMAYDERFAKQSVGTVLSSLLMEHVIDVDKVEVVDYLTGDDNYKRDWMSHRRERWGIVAFNPRTPHGLLAAARHTGGRVVRRVINTVRQFGKKT